MAALHDAVVRHAYTWERELNQNGWEKHLPSMRSQYEALCEAYQTELHKLRIKLPMNIDFLELDAPEESPQQLHIRQRTIDSLIERHRQLASLHDVLDEMLETKELLNDYRQLFQPPKPPRLIYR